MSYPEEGPGGELTRPDPPVRSATLGPAAIPSALSPGNRVGCYEVIRPLGQGGMGRVYLARDIRLGRRVALKVLETKQPEHLDRFLTEARATAQLTHENIVTLYDLEWHELSPYLVLEYVPGKTLAAWFQQRVERTGSPKAAVLPPMRAAELMLPVARAMVFMHASGVIHRDLKPSNIMLTESGLVKVLDFGIAMVTASELGDVERPRQPGIGTRAFMAPEQWTGREISERTDVWAVGVMLHWLLEGEHPAGQLGPGSLEAVADLSRPFPSLHERRPNLGRLGAIVDRCLLKDPSVRLESSRLLLTELEAVARPAELRPNAAGEPPNPYPGLAAFQEQDAARYFGREQAVERLVAALAHRPLVAVIGSSGSGKSSFVRAGVLPALARSGDAWECFSLRPGPDPLSALAELLCQHVWLTSTPTLGATDAEAQLSQAEILSLLKQEPGALGVHFRARAQRRLEHIVLFIDQFEEVVTMAAEADRRAFLAALVGAADDVSSPVRVIVSVRQDFLDRVAGESAELAALVSRGTFLLGPLGRRELRMALVHPAESLEHRFESEQLVDEILAALSSPIAALPLLQFAAHRLWEARDTERRMLTAQAYRSFGGVAGALSRHASSVLGCMMPTERDLARLILLRLVTPDRTRAVVPYQALCALSEGPEVERVIALLIDARLVSIDEVGSAESTVELVHDSLIYTWPTLARWLEEEEDSSRFQVRLRRAAEEWLAGAEREGLLWRDDAAEEARQWLHKHGPAGQARLGAPERRYLAAVMGLLERERRSRRRRVAGSFAALLLTLVAVSSLAFTAKREAQLAEAARAEAAASAARARNATRMAAATALSRDPTTVLAMTREIEPGPLPHGWATLTRWALEERVARLVIAQDASVLDAQMDRSGKVIVTAGQDGQVRVFDAALGEHRRTLSGHTTTVYSLDVSHDGRRVAAGAADGSIRVWALEGSDPRVLLGHTERVKSVRFSPDDRHLLSASADNTLRIWDLGEPGPPTVIRSKSEALRSAEYSPDGAWIAYAGMDRAVWVIRSDGRGAPRSYSGHLGGVVSASFSPDGARLLTASNDRSAQIWPASGVGPPEELRFDEPLASAQFSPDGRRQVLATDGLMVYLRTEGNEQMLALRGHSDVVFGARFSPDGKTVFTWSRDRSIRVWDLADNNRIVLRTDDGWILGTAFSPDGKLLASSGRSGLVRLWSADGSGAARVLRGPTGPANDVEFSPDGRYLASGSSDNRVQLWDLSSDAPPRILEGHKRAVRSVAFSPDGRTLASGSVDTTIALWPREGGAPRVLSGHKQSVHAVAFSPDGARLASGSSDRTVRIWDLSGNAEPIVLSGHTGDVYGVAFSRDGKRLGSGSADGTVRVWNLEAPGQQPVVLRGEGSGFGLDRTAFNADGTKLIANNDLGTVYIFSADGRGTPTVLRASHKAADTAVFSPDFQRIATGTDEGTIVIFSGLEEELRPDTPLIWAATRYCPPSAVRAQLLDFSDAQHSADLARCQSLAGR